MLLSAFHWKPPKDGLRSNSAQRIVLLTGVSMEQILSGHEQKRQEIQINNSTIL